MNKQIFLADELQQIALAKKVAKHLNSSFILLLKGDLGVGKTTFARGFIHASGFDGVVKARPILWLNHTRLATIVPVTTLICIV